MLWYRNLSIKQKQVVWAWGFLALPVLFYSVIRFYPTFGAVVLSFQDWNLLGTKTWVGLENYQKLVADPAFWKVFSNTF
ncbi:MAG: sugar ABC transporter permease, partial [Paracoccaceae bacterium]